MSRAQRGYQKGHFDIWVACDASPHMEGEYYRTWFYFSVTGVPQGELLTFTFKNLSNQVSDWKCSPALFVITLLSFVFSADQTVQSGLEAGVQSDANPSEEVASHHDESHHLLQRR